MTFNSQEIIQDVRAEFEYMLDFVTGEPARQAKADGIERGLFKMLLSMGAKLLQLFFVVPHRPVPDSLFKHKAERCYRTIVIRSECISQFLAGWRLSGRTFTNKALARLCPWTLSWVWVPIGTLTCCGK